MSRRINRLNIALDVNFQKARLTTNDKLVLKQIHKKRVELVFHKYYVDDFSVRDGKQSLYSVIRLHYFGYIEETAKGRLVVTAAGLAALES